MLKSTLIHRFPMKVRNGSSEGQTVDITVEEYFKSKQVVLDKPYLPCLDVGKPKRPNYLPIEVVALSVYSFHTCPGSFSFWLQTESKL
jgi:hypothetical protein